LRDVYDEKKRQYAGAAKELKEWSNEEVRVTLVIVSSLGAIYLPSLNDLQKVLRWSDQQLRQLGRKMPGTVMSDSMEIWRQNAHRTEKRTKEAN
jgi:hypothetical protein